MERASKRLKAVGDDESDAQQQCQEDNEQQELEESTKEQPQDDGDDRQFPVAAAAKATPELHVDEHESMYGLEDGIRWRTHQMAEDYVQLAGNLMYPGTKLGSFGYDPALRQYPMERWTSLGYLTSPLRTPTILEHWSPRDIALFEAGLMQYGKHFHKIQRHVLSGSKTTKDIIAFYYIWKKTSHYRNWKKEYVPDDDLEAWSQEFSKKKEKGR